ncbi:MAG: hypothetical protein N2316_08855 [Spirochaetes bacterium]|nr:hypothetical protein [Spirochaetota bacterium]
MRIPARHTITPLERALHMLGESTVEQCPICIKKLRDDAYEILSREFGVGKIVHANDQFLFKKSSHCPQCLVVHRTAQKGKSDADIEYALPEIVFRYHTPTNFLAGIAKKDFTDEAIAAQIASLGHGQLILLSYQIIAFRYGDGDSFAFSPNENALTIHCKILQIKKANATSSQ